MLKVALVRQGDRFSPRYVDILRKQIPRADFVLLTDRPEHSDIAAPLKRGFEGWWAKLELFSPGFRKHRPCLFLDLDTYVLGDIRDMLNFTPDKLWMLRDFYRPEGGQSAVMLIPKDTDEIWRGIGDETPRLRGGDQAYLEKFSFEVLQDRFDGIYSYKAHNLYDSPRGRIICFHGKPKPPDCVGWAGKIWNDIRD